MSREAAPRISSERLDAIRGRFPLVGTIGRDVQLKKRGPAYWGLCPFHNERSASFKVDEVKGYLHCFGCGAHGDVIRWVMRFHGLGFVEAVARMESEAGLEDPALRAAAAERERKRRFAAEREQLARERRELGDLQGLWKGADQCGGTVVETYLRSRGVRISPPASLRFRASLAYWDEDEERPSQLLRVGAWPAMVAVVQGREGQMVGLHLTWLATDGSDKAEIIHPQTGEVLPSRKMRGRCYGGAVRLGPPSGVMRFAEGIETALSVQQTGRGITWALLSLGNFSGAGLGDGGPHPRLTDKTLPPTRPDPARPGFLPPAMCRSATWMADSDNADPEAAEALVQRGLARWQRLGLKARLERAAAGMDFNDMAMAEATLGSTAS